MNPKRFGNVYRGVDAGQYVVRVEVQDPDDRRRLDRAISAVLQDAGAIGEWSHKMPTDPGLYWYRMSLTAPEVVRVRRHHDGTMHVEKWGHAEPFYLWACTGGQWYSERLQEPPL